LFIDSTPRPYSLASRGANQLNMNSSLSLESRESMTRKTLQATSARELLTSTRQRTPQTTLDSEPSGARSSRLTETTDQ